MKGDHFERKADTWLSRALGNIDLSSSFLKSYGLSEPILSMSGLVPGGMILITRFPLIYTMLTRREEQAGWWEKNLEQIIQFPRLISKFLFQACWITFRFYSRIKTDTFVSQDFKLFLKFICTSWNNIRGWVCFPFLKTPHYDHFGDHGHGSIHATGQIDLKERERGCLESNPNLELRWQKLG